MVLAQTEMRRLLLDRASLHIQSLWAKGDLHGTHGSVEPYTRKNIREGKQELARCDSTSCPRCLATG